MPEIDYRQLNNKYRCYLETETKHKKIKQTCARVYETRDDWVGKVINRELCKRLKFGHTIKRYMQKLYSVQENEP